MLPELYTARYRAESLFSLGELVAVRCSQEPPIIPLPYPLEEVAELLVPPVGAFGDSPKLAESYWRALERVGLEEIAGELAGISQRHDDKPLVLVDYEDLQKGHGSHRVVVAAWLEEHTGHPVYELTNDGERLHWSELPEQVQPLIPQPRSADHRWREDEALSWPLSHEDFQLWSRGRFWQTARSGDHQYTLRKWGADLTFEFATLFLRERGYQHKFGSRWYTQYDLDGHTYWSMGAPLAFTSLINRRLASGEMPPEPGLF
jgi:hypothetical protein